MNRKNKQESAGIRDRLKRVLLDFFRGDRSRMTAAMGADLSSLHRYLTGERTPRTAKLRSLADQTGYSIQWLLGGPADTPFGVKAASAMLPIFRGLLTCQPADADPVLRVGMRPTIAERARDTRYYFQVRTAALPASSAGDLLLIDNDPNAIAQWRPQREPAVIAHDGRPSLVLIEGVSEFEHDDERALQITEYSAKSRPIGDYRAARRDELGFLDFEARTRLFDDRSDRVVGRVLVLERDLA